VARQQRREAGEEGGTDGGEADEGEAARREEADLRERFRSWEEIQGRVEARAREEGQLQQQQQREQREREARWQQENQGDRHRAQNIDNEYGAVAQQYLPPPPFLRGLPRITTTATVDVADTPTITYTPVTTYTPAEAEAYTTDYTPPITAQTPTAPGAYPPIRPGPSQLPLMPGAYPPIRPATPDDDIATAAATTSTTTTTTTTTTSPAMEGSYVHPAHASSTGEVERQETMVLPDEVAQCLAKIRFVRGPP
jgi:hypothetical protein